MWSTDSSLPLQRLDLLAMNYPLFINVSTVKSFPQIAFQAKKRLLRVAHEPQISLAGNKILLLAFNDL